uniref:Uncharacterized protein n=1 Tax=Trichobilharzia regenti TaxID=157069 RepID=A0AA85J4X9_TRIRE|nr:unnamed protein product [Trichobilharzia regenti]
MSESIKLAKAYLWITMTIYDLNQLFVRGTKGTGQLLRLVLRRFDYHDTYCSQCSRLDHSSTSGMQIHQRSRLCDKHSLSPKQQRTEFEFNTNYCGSQISLLRIESSLIMVCQLCPRV